MKKIIISLFTVCLLFTSCKKETYLQEAEGNNTAAGDSSAVTKNIPAGPVANTILTDQYVKHI